MSVWEHGIPIFFPAHHCMRCSDDTNIWYHLLRWYQSAILNKKVFWRFICIWDLIIYLPHKKCLCYFCMIFEYRFENLVANLCRKINWLHSRKRNLIPYVQKVKKGKILDLYHNLYSIIYLCKILWKFCKICLN